MTLCETIPNIENKYIYAGGVLVSNNSLYAIIHGNARSRLYQFVYAFVVSLLYSWCVFQAWIYDAKTQTGEIYMYFIVYFIFAFLVRSMPSLIWMNALSLIVVLPGFVLNSLLSQAGSYFGLGRVLAVVGTILALAGQSLIMLVTRKARRKYFSQKRSMQYFLCFGFLFTIGFTLFVSLHPYTANG